MRECPRCFWLAMHKIWKRPSGIFPSLPNGMDKILKEHFDKFMKKGQMPPELCEKNRCDNLRLFDEENLLNQWRNNFKGIEWTDNDGNMLRGAVDNILVNKDSEKLIVLDYKTRGFPLKEDSHTYYQLQLDLYNFLLRMNDYETESFAFLLFYIPKEVKENGEILFDTELIKMNVSVESGKKAYEGAIELLNGPCPNENCEWCKSIKVDK
jgi:hypothetical protein